MKISFYAHTTIVVLIKSAMCMLALFCATMSMPGNTMAVVHAASLTTGNATAAKPVVEYYQR